MRPGRSPARVALAGGVMLWSVTAGTLGVILAMLWLFTDHTAAYPNQNLLLLNPISLVLAVIGPLALGRRRSWTTSHPAVPIAAAALLLAMLALLLHAIPGAAQANGALIALVLPVHAAVLAVLYPVTRGQSSTHVDTPDPVVRNLP